MDRKLRGHTETIGQRMERDLDALLHLPPVAYDACDKQAGRVSSLSLVRYRTNPLLGAAGLRIPGRAGTGLRRRSGDQLRNRGHRQHPRSYERDDFVYDPIHYLPLGTEAGRPVPGRAAAGLGTPR